jgi:hypothetical protein
MSLSIKAGDDAQIKRQTVTGAISLKGTSIHELVVLDDVDFEGAVDFSDCVFEHSLLFTGCTFRQGFSLKNAELHGELLFDAVRMLGWSHQYIASALRLEGAHIDGDVQIRPAS